MEEYICWRHNTIAEWIVMRPLFAKCWEGKRKQGLPRHIFWWEQEFDLDLDTDICPYRSDGSATLAETGCLWGSNRGG
ncbi:MAG: hypothetical protein GY874_14055 [Desulfobacteraceae bacterium]|nr:hypothetical protein [Desulfobacteraceae bacterium]